MREVIPQHLWIGNAQDARDMKGISAREIGVIIDLALEEPPIQVLRDLVYCRFPLIDGEGNAPTLLRSAIDSVVNFVGDGMPTLVACGAGSSRSPAIVAAAFALAEGGAPEEALARVIGAGAHDVSPTLWADVKDACILC